MSKARRRVLFDGCVLVVILAAFAVFLALWMSGGEL